MRKSEKRAVKNKPAAETNKIKVAMTPEEKESARKTLALAKKLSTGYKVLPKGFSYNLKKKKKEK